MLEIRFSVKFSTCVFTGNLQLRIGLITALVYLGHGLHW